MAIYLDNAATTKIAPEVIEAMLPVLRDGFGNPSSTHSFGRKSKAILETSRRSIAKHINANPSEIIFTSGGTEADNIAINSAVSSMGVNRIIQHRLNIMPLVIQHQLPQNNLVCKLKLLTLTTRVM